MSKITVKQLRERIYQFTEWAKGTPVDAYLVIGEKKAVMLDGLEAASGLYEMAREVTDLPLEMIVLHGHPDHAGSGCGEFIRENCPVFMQEADYPLLKDFDIFYPAEAFTWMQDGEMFDLGGISLQMMSLPGHTPGSCVLYCKEEHILFSSDSLGSGDIWMWLPHSLPLDTYEKYLEEVYEFLRSRPDTVIYPGHTEQIPDYRRDGEKYMDLAYVEDLLENTRALISGEKVGIPVPSLAHRMGEIDVRTLQGKIMIGYTYDPAKRRTSGKNPESGK
ncbi:MAG: MBL fold metallo-hydrolase [Fusicatenibacter sp.]|nr:MBL fold metallo-hydrolase [Lachnospiraceae bacterium]MDY2939228.1 MBL fold metallo-hydrolase [Fusicatenibacter sp.]